MKRLFAGLVAVGTLATGGTVAADRQINPYLSDGSTLRIDKDSVLPEAGTTAVVVDTTQPKITLSKWGGKVAMGVTYQGLKSEGGRPLLSKNVTWTQDPKQSMEAVPIDATTTMEDGGMEININLPSKPASNVFTFAISGAEQLDFFYQPALTKEEIDEGASRPDNVIGSYAVYYKNHRDHIVGQTNYATGKAYHIFRPLVTDAKGKTVWADLSYTAGTLTVTVPQSFLDTASYPVIVDPTFGYSSQGVTNGPFGGNTLDGSNLNIAVSSNGSVDSVFAYGRGSGVNMKGVITNSSFAILTNGVSNPVALTGSNIWNQADYSSKPSVTSGSSFIPWAIFDNTMTLFFDTGAGTNSYFKLGNSYASPTNPTSPSADTNKYSIYATYTAGAAATASYTTITEPKGTLTVPRGVVSVP